MQSVFAEFRFWHNGRCWKFQNWPRIGNRDAPAKVIRAHLDGTAQQIFDATTPRRERRPLGETIPVVPYTSA